MQDRFKYRYFFDDKLYDVLDANFESGYITVRRNEEIVTIMIDFERLVQSAGLKDKNGKLIYEGDIVKVYKFSTGRTSNRVVVWNEARCGCRLYTIDNYKRNLHTCPQSMVNVTTIEVIGNIYENPELLEDA